MTVFLFPLGATITPWMLALIAAVLVAGMVLVFLGMRRQRSGDGTGLPVEGEGTAAGSLGLRETGEDTDLDDMLTDQTFVDGNVPGRGDADGAASAAEGSHG